METIKVRGEQSPSQCPYCKDQLAPGKDIAACVDCGAHQHLACHQEHGACTACSSNNVLVPQAKRKKVSYREPLKGSTIRVQATESGTRYSWQGCDAMPWALAMVLVLGLIAAILTIPLAIWILYERWKKPGEREFSVELKPDRIEFETFEGKRKRVLRKDVGRVKVLTQQGVSNLTVDVGVDRLNVYNTAFKPRLKPPELEWLADAINAWKDQD